MNLGGWEIAVIVGVIVLVFGPSQLPKLGKSLGATIKEFRNVGKELQDSVKDEDRDR